MQLCQSEAFRVLDNNDRSVRDIHANLNNRGRDKDVSLILSECFNSFLNFFGFHVAGDCLDCHFRVRLKPFCQLFVGRLNRINAFQSFRIRIFNQRAHDITLMTFLDLIVYGFIAAVFIRPDNGLYRLAPGRHRMDIDDFGAFPIQSVRQRARDWRSAHADIVNAVFCFLLECFTLLNAEPMFLVYNR